MQTARLSLPFIMPGQAQKEMSHNEALQILDTLVAASVAGVPTNNPPSSPAVGSQYLVGSLPTAAWVGKANALASWTESGWRFFAPKEGQEVTETGSRMRFVFDGSTWVLGEVKASSIHIQGKKVIGVRQADVPAPTGGAVIDPEARSAISALLTALRVHGLIGN